MKNHNRIDFTLNYDNNLYSWFLDKHITHENPPREFNPIHDYKRDSYYKQWNLDCAILIQRNNESSVEKISRTLQQTFKRKVHKYTILRSNQIHIMV